MTNFGKPVKNKNLFKNLGENAFLPTCLKLKINFYKTGTGVLWSVQNSS
jgi:hypothetical protein